MKYVIEPEGGNFGRTIIEAENIEEAESRTPQWVRDLSLGDAASQVGLHNDMQIRGGKSNQGDALIA